MDNFAIPIPLNVSEQNHNIPLNAAAVPTGTTDYNHLTNRPSLNGVLIEGDHDSEYYHLPTEEEVDNLKSAVDWKAPAIFETASGSVASFVDGAADMPLKSLLVNIEPVQAGSGDPSPENVRPISGWTGCNVTRTGKNLVDKAEFVVGSISGTGEDTVLYNRLRSPFIPAEPRTQYGVSVNSGLLVYELHQYDAGQKWLGLTAINAVSGTVTTGSDTRYVKILIRSPDNSVITVSALTAFQLEKGPVTAYEPYTGTTIPISWESEAGTVYGGTLDAVSGVLTVTHASMTITGGMNYYREQGNHNRYISTILDNKAKAGSALLTNMATTWPGDTTQLLYVILTSGRSQFSLFASKTIEDINTFLSTNPLQVVYELATPITYQITPQEVTTLLGANNIWADCGPVDVEYPADTKLYIQNINAPTDEDMTADTQIASGKYFLVGNTLYLSTTTIPTGDTIIPGTNCTKTNLAEALNALNT